MATRTKKRSNNTLWLLLVLLVVVGALVYLLPDGGEKSTAAEGVTTETAAATEEEMPVEATRVQVGDMAPDFTVEMFDGSRTTLSSLRGKVVLLNFWATWCPPCRKELKRVQHDVIDRFAGRDFVFLPVSRGEKREAVEAIKKGDTDTAKAILRPIPKVEPEEPPAPFTVSEFQELIHTAIKALDASLKQHMVLVHREMLDISAGRDAAMKELDRGIDVIEKYKNMIRMVSENGTEN